MKKFFCLCIIISICFINTIAFSEDDTDNLTNISNQYFHNIININDINDIVGGVIVNKTEKKCADIEYADLKKWLNVYWNFNYEIVLAPLSAFDIEENYIKFWTKNKDKAFVVYSNGGIIAGKYGDFYELNGSTKQNYVWYLPVISNSRNALNTADMTLQYTYFMQCEGITYKGYKQRKFVLTDDTEIPQNNLLITDNASGWAVPEIKKAAAYNLMIYDLQTKYPEPITRYEFCKLAYRLIATEFNPNSDSRMGVGLVIQNVLNERGITDTFANKFSDCDFAEVDALTSMGIIQGMGDGTFLPNSYITREQAAVILYRTAEFLGNKTIIYPQYEKLYDDEDKISYWAKSYVASMKAMNVMNGISEREFAPNQIYTVEQAIATMLRLYECS